MGCRLRVKIIQRFRRYARWNRAHLRIHFQELFALNLLVHLNNRSLGIEVQSGPFQTPSVTKLGIMNHVLERLANEAYFLYLKQEPAEKAKLLKMALSNCAVDAASATRRTPFDLIFHHAKNEGWRARRDDFRTFLDDFVASLATGCAFVAG